MTKALRLAATTCGLFIAGCCCHKKESTTQTAAANNPVIVRLVSRQQVVTISASRRGPVYNIATTDGKTLVADATLSELAANHPDLYRQLAPALATQGDAGLARNKKPTTKPIPADLRPDYDGIMLDASATR